MPADSDIPGRTADPYWSRSVAALLAEHGSGPGGLSEAAAAERLATIGPNRVADETSLSAFRLLLRQFESPLVLILLFGAAVSLLLREWVDSGIILAIVLGSAALGFLQEFRASNAVAELRQRLALKARVVRGGAESAVPFDSIVPGDIVLLAAGNLIPADGVLIEAQDFLASEASLTGESFPVEKKPGAVAADAILSQRCNCVFMGASVRSGTAKALIVSTGIRTALGGIAESLKSRAPETEFQRGIAGFGRMLVKVMMLIVIAVFAANQLLGRPVAESLLFSVALAVGLSPELLPAIITVTLSAGARELARGGVIVRRLEAIENLGSMDVFCSDKTGTVTVGAIVLEGGLDASGGASESVTALAFANSAVETGIENPLDSAVVAYGARHGLSALSIRKVDEIPYDFSRRRLTIVVDEGEGSNRLICKGAFADVLGVCGRVRAGEGERPIDQAVKDSLETLFRERSANGYRVLALASSLVAAKPDYDRGDERDLVFEGLLLFSDPIKADAADTVARLKALGVAVKIISGDNRYVTAHVGAAIGLDAQAMLTGGEVAAMKDEALWHHAPRTDLFVEIDPQQKERIVRALQRRGHAVGYMGDGINDAPALHAADVGISVNGAVDIARESADIVLLKPDLDVLRQGVVDGRRTFANTLKYISITTSANFGNMISMAAVTPLLPFLPLLPTQILLNNFLSDLPSIAISTDRVDEEQLARPQRWDVDRIRRFMIVFGLGSSLFDFVTFGALLFLLHADARLFHTGWFLVSLLTELGVVLVLRTRRPALRSRASPLLLWSTLATSAATFILPLLPPVRALFGFTSLDLPLLAATVAIVAAYLLATEWLKRLFFRSRLGMISGA